MVFCFLPIQYIAFNTQETIIIQYISDLYKIHFQCVHGKFPCMYVLGLYSTFPMCTW